MLRVAVTPTLAHSLAPPAIEAFRSTRPDAAVNVLVAGLRDVARLVLDHRVDLGMVLGAAGDARLSVHDLYALPLGCVLPQGHPLCALSKLNPHDLGSFPVISVRTLLNPLQHSLDFSVPACHRLSHTLCHATLTG